MDHRALIIDNSVIWRDTLADVLVDTGIQIDQAGNASEAIALARKRTYQLALVDGFLDRVSFGWLALDVIDKLRHRSPKTSVMVVTERALTEAERQQLRELGVISVFDKSRFTLQEMRREVDAVIHTSPYRIFITYRREDGQCYAAILHHLLNARLGARSVFMDIYDIPGGTRWNESIRHIIPECEAMIVLIGKQWQTHARSRHDKTDYVREEIGIAARQNIKIIPVLIEHASLPEHIDGDDKWFADVRAAEAIAFTDLHADHTIVERILKDLGMDSPL